jgi:hypothetical protein
MPENNKSQNQQPTEKLNEKSRRGFASMDKDKHKIVSSEGGDKTQRVKPEERARRRSTGYEGL